MTEIKEKINNAIKKLRGFEDEVSDLYEDAKTSIKKGDDPEVTEEMLEEIRTLQKEVKNFISALTNLGVRQTNKQKSDSSDLLMDFYDRQIKKQYGKIDDLQEGGAPEDQIQKEQNKLREFQKVQATLMGQNFKSSSEMDIVSAMELLDMADSLIKKYGNNPNGD